MIHRISQSLILTILSTFAAATYGKTPQVVADTTTHALQELVVISHKTDDVIPAQTLTGDELHRLNSASIADALRYFSGIQVKDYGGVGGLKTVNIRSMGTNHTGVVYDGVELGNAQNGQIDLGQFSLDNMEALSLYNGQKSEILQPAKDFGSAGSIYMRTRIPHFSKGENYHARLIVRAGSFDLINPSALVELRLSGSINASLSTEWVNSSGKYKFRYKRVTPSGDVAYDTTAVRQNGDINALRVELNFNGILRNGNWRFKAYTYNSERGVPGAIVNNVWRRGERIGDSNSFAQGSYTGNFGRLTTLNNIKYAFYRTHYVNNDETQIKIDNLYRQREFYFSTANQFEIYEWWKVSMSYDLNWNTLLTDIYGFAIPNRWSNFLSVATSFNIPRFSAQASVLGTFIHDKIRGQNSPKYRHVFTPAVFAAFKPLHNPDLSLRAFFKQSFRMPTFNDLYYADMGNSKLEPERVTQYNFGFLYDHVGNGVIAAAKAQADVYYNKVKNKIVAYPKGQQFRWTMLNLGMVDIKGIDVSGLVTFKMFREWFLTIRTQYTFQRAIDVTNPTDNYYRDQIPYIPRNSGAVVGNLTWKGWCLNYSWIYVGGRYNQQENIKFNYTQPWYTSDISLSKDIRLGRVKLRGLVEVNNLLSQDYDVILNYPMPKRNYRFTISAEI